MEALGQEGIKLIRDSSMVMGTLVNLTLCSAGKSQNFLYVLIEPTYIGVEEEIKWSFPIQQENGFVSRSLLSLKKFKISQILMPMLEKIGY